MAQESSEEESNMEREEEITAKKDVPLVAKERLEEVDFGSNPWESKPISISSRLPEEEKSELILLLKEFEDVFA